MMVSLGVYVRRGQRVMKRWLLDPRIHTLVQSTAYLLAGFGISAASLGNRCQPLALGLICAVTGWPALLIASGSMVGYLFFWSSAGAQGVVWIMAGVLAAILLGGRSFLRDTPLLMPALSGLIVAAVGLIFQILNQDTTPIALYLLRIVVAAVATRLFSVAVERRDPVVDWVVCALAVLALAQISITPYVGLGYIAAGLLTCVGAFPAAALAGLALDLSQITRVPMTAVMSLAYLLRLLPWGPKKLYYGAPAAGYFLVMGLCGIWDVTPLAGLVLGGLGALPLPVKPNLSHRRGETGVAQVRLEMASAVLRQAEELMASVDEVPIDEGALIARAAERACGSCPCRKSCKDTKRIAQLPGLILHKPLLTVEEIPINCRKSGRFLAELHRSQEQLRSIQADRERQREYRAAVIQQYQFLSEYLQELADQLPRHPEGRGICYCPQIRVYGNRPEQDNGDRFARFAGTAARYYVLLCDGMGTGLGAVQEGKTASSVLRRLLSAGYPAEHALRSLNSLCALRERAGAVTVDLAELQLDSGEAALYKWGAAPSYLVSKTGAERIGTAGPPPGLSVTDCQESCYRLSLRRGQTLFMVSDGVGEEEALRCCIGGADLPPGELAARLLTGSQLSGEDDATVVTVRLDASAI